MNFKTFVKNKCAAACVKFTFSDKPFVSTGSGIKCNGYFDGESRELAVAGGQPEDRWLKILVHEYAHMTQWQDQTKIWIDGTAPLDAENLVEQWYDRKLELTKAQRAHWIELGRNVEWEAESRVLKMIDAYSLPIDQRSYAQHANSYLYFWTFTGLVRRWYEIGKEPYNTPEIVAAMPLLIGKKESYSVLPKKFESLYRRYC